MSRRRMAGNADYKGRLNAVASQLLDEIKGTNRYSNYREIDEVFPTRVTRDNADELLLALAPRTPVKISGSTVTGGDAIVDKKGRVNLDNIPHSASELISTAPDAVNSDSSPLAKAFLYPDDAPDTPALARAKGLGMAMQKNDVDAYQRVGSPIQVDDDAAAYIAGMLIKGKAGKPLRSGSFAVVGGLGSDSRSQILIPGTDKRFVDLSKEEKAEYMDQRTIDLTKQWLAQGGASIGNPSTAIIPPGVGSHMDHVRALSSSIDTIGDKGWGYSDSLPNFSWLDAEANVHSKLNYSLQGQHAMMQAADRMRKANLPFPARLSQAQLGDPNRRRLTDEEGAIRLVTDKATNVNDAGEQLLEIIRYFNRNS